MADEHIRAPRDQVRGGVPQPAGNRAPANGRADERRGAAAEPPLDLGHGLLFEGLLLVRWLAGLVIVLACGWGFIVAVALLARGWKVGVPLEVAAAVAAALSLGVFVLLERNFWLSRFMGLCTSPHGSPLAEATLLWALGVPGLLLRSTAAPAPEAARGKARPSEADSLREVVETVVFVIVLVLMLKTFVAEAFVIPTGSMAETLLGYHRVVACPACGYTFPVNISAEVDPQSPQPPQRITGCTCPNCRLHIEFDNQGQRGGLLP